MKFKIGIFLVIVLACFFMPTASAEPTITLVSFTPETLETNYTGLVEASYMVESAEPLNLSSVAFLYGLNYTIPSGGDMHNYISAPANDLSFEGIYRAPNRNVSPYLTWEFNTTITNNSVWQWGGCDINSLEISTSVINSTHTYVNATGYTQFLLPSSFYLSILEVYLAPKTGFEINNAQGIIIKMWNLEEIRNRDADYLANMYFDTAWESTEPTDVIQIGYCNYSYDPATDDIDTSPYCAAFGSWNGTRWIDYSWVPTPYASYAAPIIINASQVTDPIPTDINYVWLRSDTLSSKSYVLNATNSDPGITNITFAETETMWTYNELNGVTTPLAYTPSFFVTYARDDEDLLHHLYIADDTGVWGHSEIFNESIGVASVAVSPVSFEHFNILCSENYIDMEMDATYDGGGIEIGIRAPADPDGGPVTHNLTLHYSNETLVATINDTLTTTGDELINVSFVTTPYYTSDAHYTLRCVSTDDEGSVVTKWLVSDFTLDADGNQGWISNGSVNFWGFDDIQSLYTTINNNSLLSYDIGDETYTMHIPFFKSKFNDTFTLNETLHLKSLNDTNVVYFRFVGDTIFDGAEIYGWNTTTDTYAPSTDTYRAYVYSLSRTCGNITDSNLSYLGSDNYRQEGLNFATNTFTYLIHNSTFSNNGKGPIFEECVNVTISNSTISDTGDAGVGVYFSSNFIIENSTITDNNGRGISVYEGHNNIIRYNTITGSGASGIQFWSNSANNTALGNTISGNTLYDYYLSSSAIGNFIIDPASDNNTIRVTSTSNVNIENSDNTVFTEDSSITSYAYPTNFSMYVSGLTHTLNITQENAVITPSTDRVSIWDLDINETTTLNGSSNTSDNPTYFNITNEMWIGNTVSIYINDTLNQSLTSVDDTGMVSFYYEGVWSDKYFTFKGNPIELSSPNPATGAEVIQATSQTFSISSSAISNSVWTLDSTDVETDLLSTFMSYSIPLNLNLGTHNLRITSSNAYNLTDSTTYNWQFTIVTAPPIGGGGGSSSGPSVSPGGSDEPESNVLCSETGRIRNIERGERVSYIVQNKECLKITTVSFIPTANVWEQSIVIEALSDRSLLVTEDVPNNEILNFNLFTGYLGFDSKTEEEKIFFRLRKDTMETAGLDEATVKLYKWSDDKSEWIQKYTDMIDSDDYHYYYEADSGATTGRFAVSAKDSTSDSLSLGNIVSNLPGFGNTDYLLPDFIRIPIVDPFIKTIENFVNGIISTFMPSLAPEEDTEVLGFTFTTNQAASVEQETSKWNVIVIALLALLFTGILAFYFNTDSWNISMMLSIALITIIYLLLGDNMIVILESGTLNSLMNVILITTISYLGPIAGDVVRGKSI